VLLAQAAPTAPGSFRSRSSRPRLDVEREDVPPPAVRIPKAIATAYSDSWVIETAMPAHPQLLGPAPRAAVERDGRLPGRQPLHLDVRQPMPADAQAQDLRTASLAAQRPANVSGRSRT
jgi:hypothetical protein